MSLLRRRRRRKVRPEESFQAINITPFTDVLLVLLIIFLIAGSSLVPSGLPVQSLAKETAGAVDQSLAAVAIVVAESGSLKITSGGRTMKLEDLLKLERSTQVSLAGEESASVDKVIRLYDQLLGEGFQQIQLAAPVSSS